MAATDLEMAEAIDRMEGDVTSWEADFLESILPKLRAGWELSENQARVLKKMYVQYITEDSR